MMQNGVKWSENVIVADADYVDKVAFDLIVNFERMLGRRVPQADLARWCECIALDGGLRQGEHETHVVLIHHHQKKQLQNFVPAHYEQELNGQAFSGALGEFELSAITGEGLATTGEVFTDTLRLIGQQKEVKRLMVIPSEEQYSQVRETLRQIDDGEKHITVFTMQPMAGGSFRQEILGYSLMAALGIKGEEINNQL